MKNECTLAPLAKHDVVPGPNVDALLPSMLALVLLRGPLVAYNSITVSRMQLKAATY